MKICTTSTEKTLQSEIDPRFGRSQYFVIYDTKTKENEIIKNPYTDGGGAGTKVGQLMIDKNINLVISGEPGPNAKFVLDQAGIKFQNADLTKSVEENINNISI